MKERRYKKPEEEKQLKKVLPKQPWRNIDLICPRKKIKIHKYNKREEYKKKKQTENGKLKD